MRMHQLRKHRQLGNQGVCLLIRRGQQAELQAASRVTHRQFFQIRRGRFVLGEVGHELGPDTPPGEANDLEGARDRALADADRVAHTKRLGGLGRGVVEANLAAAAGFRRLAARLEQAHGEQPFVHPHFLRLVHRG